MSSKDEVNAMSLEELVEKYNSKVEEEEFDRHQKYLFGVKMLITAVIDMTYARSILDKLRRTDSIGLTTVYILSDGTRRLELMDTVISLVSFKTKFHGISKSAGVGSTVSDTAKISDTIASIINRRLSKSFINAFELLLSCGVWSSRDGSHGTFKHGSRIFDVSLSCIYPETLHSEKKYTISVSEVESDPESPCIDLNDLDLSDSDDKSQ